MTKQVEAYFPLLGQLKSYNRQKLTSDLVAACVVTVMLIPQSLAYAMLAGLPPQVGLYASITPLLAYAIFGSCNTLAVGPVAIASLMTASALSEVAQYGISYTQGAMLLALLSGGFLALVGVLRLGFLANFLSHSVVSGFITASALVIALSQAKHLLGITAEGHSFFELLRSFLTELTGYNLHTLIVGTASLAFLFSARKYAALTLQRLGLSKESAVILSKTAPVLGVIVTTLAVATLNLDKLGVATVGEVPVGIPVFAFPTFPIAAVKALLLPAILIAIIGYVESISVGKTLSAKRQEKIDGNQELVALGAANLAAGFSSSFPVTGGFARSVVNFEAGAVTQMAGVFTAIGILLAALFLTPLLFYLPVAMLAATIIVAVLSLVDLSIFKEAWKFSKGDFYAILMTVCLTLIYGVEIGVASGIATSILLHMYFTSKPYTAEIGLIEGTQHFRNINHFEVQTDPQIVSIRVDESLLFSNAEYLEEKIEQLIAERENLRDIILHCGGINQVDLSALKMLSKLNLSLLQRSIKLHLSELKIPVQRRLERSSFLEELGGELFLSQYDAYSTLHRLHKEEKEHE